MTHTVIIGNQFTRDRAKALIDRAPPGYVCEVRPKTRSDAQNRKLWPMILDIRRQVPGMDAFTRDDIKLRFLNSLGVEMRFLPELDGGGLFPVGQRSSTLTKEQFSGLLELLYEYGARHGVVWSNIEEEAA
jgi:hypothetical protein